MDALQSALISLIAAIASAAAYFINKRTKKTCSEVGVPSVTAIERSAAIYEILFQYAKAISADRVLILYTANGGGIPHPMKELNVTILYELLNSTQAHTLIRNRFHHVPLDRAYIQMLINVVSKGYWEGTPDDLDEGFLKTLYNEEGVQYARITELEATEFRYYFLSARWFDKSKVPTQAALDLAGRTVASQLLQFINENN
jgi:hypothetical protein